MLYIKKMNQKKKNPIGIGQEREEPAERRAEQCGGRLEPELWKCQRIFRKKIPIWI